MGRYANFTDKMGWIEDEEKGKGRREMEGGRAAVLEEAELMEAAAAGELEQVRRLVERGVDVNASGTLGETPLMQAAYKGHLDVVCLLVESDVDIDAVDIFDRTALFHAVLATNPNLEIVRCLLSHGADRRKRLQGWTDLMWAALLGDLEDVKRLVGLGADVNADEDELEEHGTALMKAALCGHLEVVQFLVDSGATINKMDQLGSTALCAAAKNGHINVVRYLIDCGADVCQSSTLNGRTALRDASENGNLEVVRYLVSKGANVNAIGNDSALLRAALGGYFEIVRYLVERGADVDATDSEGGCALFWAMKFHHLDIARYLLANGATRLPKWWPEGCTKLMDAAIFGDLKAAQDFINSNADVNDAASDGSTALMNAARYGHIEVVHLLVDHGATVNAKNDKGWTALLRTRGVEVARYLLDHGADANDQLSDKCSALMKASSADNLNLVKLFLERGADVNAADENGWTALFYAANSDIARHLISHGADINATSCDSRTALTIAIANENIRMVSCLVEFGAQFSPMDFIIGANKGNLQIIRFMVSCGMDINSKNDDGQTALMETAHQYGLHILRYLINLGADCNAYNRKGSTALMQAAGHGAVRAVCTLIEHGADISLIDDNGWTALMSAASGGHVEVVRYLIEVGADVNTHAIDGSTALSLASSNGHGEVKHLLMKYIRNDSNPDLVSQQRIIHPASDRLSEWIISPLDIEVLQISTSAGVGGEFLAKWLDADVVLKLFVPDAYDSSFDNEVKMWHQFRHPNVIKLYGACNVGHHFFVCEYASHGSAVDLLALCAPGEKTPWKYLHHAALGLVYLHERGVVHGNLRGDNILIGSDGLAKLANFSVYKSLRKANDEFNISSAFDESTRWVSPEELEGKPASFSSDIYSLGLCAVQLVTAKLPWNHLYSRTIIPMTKSEWFPESSLPSYNVPTTLQGTLHDVIKRVCCNDPKLRVSASQCARIFERQAEEEATLLRNKEPEPEVSTNIRDFENGELPVAWAKLQEQVENNSGEISNDLDQYRIILDDLEAIYTRLEDSSHSVDVFNQVLELILDISSALSTSTKSSIALQLSSTRATMNIASTFQRRVDAMKRLLGLQANENDSEVGFSTDADDETNVLDEKQNTDIQVEKAKQLQIFISEISNTLAVLEKLETTGERTAFLVCLQAEISNHTNNYTPGQLQIMQQAFDEIKSKTDANDDSLLTAPVWFIPWYELIVNQWNRVGNGGFGSVYRAKWLDSEVVVKQVDYPGGDDDPIKRDEARKMFMSEVNIWFHLSHPHVVRLFGACHIGPPFFVCEFAPNGALDDYLAVHPDEIWHKLREAALGLLYLHERGIIHCDLKCNNVVIGSDGKAKVTDFGLSSAVDTMDDNDSGAHVSGAWHWVAPEVLTGSAPTRDSDVYSFGMCIVEAMRVVEASPCNDGSAHNEEVATFPWVVRNHPLPNAAVKAHKKRGKLPSRPTSCTDAQWELIEKMCRLDPSERLPICAVVDELEVFAQAAEEKSTLGPSNVQAFDLLAVGNVISSMQSLIESKRPTTSGANSDIYDLLKLLWNRLADLQQRLKADEVVTKRFGLFVAEAQVKSTNLLASPPATLLQVTESGLESYSLHRRLDKLMAAMFVKIPDEDKTGRSLHDWKAKQWL